MFVYPTWAVGSYRSGPTVAQTVGTKSTGGCYQQYGSLCRGTDSLTFEMHGDECAGHGRVAGQEERAALLEAAGEAVADRVHPEVGTVVPHPHHDRRLAALG